MEQFHFEGFGIGGGESEFLGNCAVHVEDSLIKPTAAAGKVAMLLGRVEPQQLALPLGFGLTKCDKRVDAHFPSLGIAAVGPQHRAITLLCQSTEDVPRPLVARVGIVAVRKEDDVGSNGRKEIVDCGLGRCPFDQIPVFVFRESQELDAVFRQSKEAETVSLFALPGDHFPGVIWSTKVIEHAAGTAGQDCH